MWRFTWSIVILFLIIINTTALMLHVMMISTQRTAAVMPMRIRTTAFRAFSITTLTTTRTARAFQILPPLHPNYRSLLLAPSSSSSSYWFPTRRRHTASSSNSIRLLATKTTRRKTASQGGNNKKKKDNNVTKDEASNTTISTETTTNIPQRGTLFSYQEVGVERLMEQKRLLLADEMGLGKTVQCIQAINQIANAKQPTGSQTKKKKKHNIPMMRILIVCPKSVLGVWQSELEHWLDADLHQHWTTHVAQTKPGRKTKKKAQQEPKPNIGDAGTITLINYDICHKLEEELRQPEKYDVIICDEAHYLKSPDTKRTMSIFGSHIAKTMKSTARSKAASTKAKLNTTALKSDYLWLLTGTPVLNRPLELFPLLSALDPNQFDDFMEYANRYCDPKDKTIVTRRRGGGATQRFQIKDYSGASNLQELSQRLEHVMLRRYKSDVLHELPAKFRSCTSLTTDVDIAQQELERLRASFEESIKNGTEATNATSLGGLGNFGSNAQELVSYMSRMPEGQTENAVFGMISSVRRETAWLKLKPAIELLEEYTQQEKVVVFAHHLDLIDDLMKHFGNERAVCVKGGMSVEKRSEAVQRFQSDKDVRIFIGSIRAAGVGVTLTAASLVIFLELDWSPSVMNQAEDRCHRVGQKQNVRVQYLVFKDTIDEWLSKLLIYKHANIRQILPDATSHNMSYTLDFGKHAGLRLGDVPRSYVDYLIRQRIWENRRDLWVALHDMGLVLDTPPPLSPPVRQQKFDNNPDDEIEVGDDDLEDARSRGPPSLVEDRPSPLSKRALQDFDGHDLADTWDPDYAKKKTLNLDSWPGFYPEEDYYGIYDDENALVDEHYKDVHGTGDGTTKTAQRDSSPGYYFPHEDDFDTIDDSALVDEYYKEKKRDTIQAQDVNSHEDSRARADGRQPLQRPEQPYSFQDPSGLAPKGGPEQDHSVHTAHLQVVDYTFDFGKYRGKRWNDVPPDYRSWILKEEVWKGRARANLRKALLQARVPGAMEKFGSSPTKMAGNSSENLGP